MIDILPRTAGNWHELGNLKKRYETAEGGALRGVTVTKENEQAIEKSASVGFMHLGTEVVHYPDGRISLHPTAGTTELGKSALKHC